MQDGGCRTEGALELCGRSGAWSRSLLQLSHHLQAVERLGRCEVLDVACRRSGHSHNNSHKPIRTSGLLSSNLCETLCNACGLRQDLPLGASTAGRSQRAVLSGAPVTTAMEAHDGLEGHEYHAETSGSISPYLPATGGLPVMRRPAAVAAEPP